MESSQSKAVTACWKELVAGLSMQSVLIELRTGERPVVDHMAANVIKTKMHTLSEELGAEALLEHLLKTNGSFIALIKALDDTNQEHLAKQLRAKEADISRTERAIKAHEDFSDAVYDDFIRASQVGSPSTSARLPLLEQPASSLAEAFRASFDLAERVLSLETQLMEKDAELVHLSNRNLLIAERQRLKAQLHAKREELDVAQESLGRNEKDNAKMHAQLDGVKETLSRYEEDNVKMQSLLQPFGTAIIFGGDDRESVLEYLPLLGGPIRSVFLTSPSRRASSALLPDGRIFSTGGQSHRNGPCTASCSYIDVATLAVSSAPALPWNIAEHATVTMGDTVFSVGGFDGRQRIPHCAAFRDGVWKRINDIQHRRHCHAIASDGMKLAVFGGSFDQGIRLASVELYSPGADTWTSGPDMEEAKHMLRAAHLEGRFFACGGDDRKTEYSQLTAWDPRTSYWTILAPMLSARLGHGLLALADKLYAFGGCVGDEEQDTVEVYDPAADHWAPTEARLSKPGSNFGFCAL